MSQYIGYGIDLGTTNSCVAHCDAGGDVRVFQNNDQMNVTPSAVHVLRTGRVIVGRRAYNAAATETDNVATGFKRSMGMKFGHRFPASGRTLSAEELSAEVLKSMLEDVARQTGTRPDAAVITVPAAFGIVQCEATGRAARLAGLDDSPLLQEPIAAALAYGARPGARDQRWLVFDLGGGTLDIAVVSTRDGRLTVLEHQGDNYLGGRDVDRRIAERYFLPALAGRTPDPNADDRSAGAYRALVRRLLLKAEEAKIELSSANQVVVDFSDLTDADGEPLEGELTIGRSQLEGEMADILENCARLAERALAGAKMAAADLDRVLLVGGPTQMPIVRSFLAERLGARVDFSLDPMTVVARGAAVYASAAERSAGATLTAADPGSRGPAAGGADDRATVLLAYEPVSLTTRCPVAGRVTDPSGRVAEVRVDAAGGYWTSGWVAAPDGVFETTALLREDLPATRFQIAARDARGRGVPLEPSEFTVRLGLTPAAPPLPHPICVEVATAGGGSALTEVFPRLTPLPATRTVPCRASRALRPGDPDQFIAIKLWEGETLDRPQANTWIGHVRLWSHQLRRPIAEGAEIELTVRVDASRRVQVEAFVPALNEHFARELYLPEPVDPREEAARTTERLEEHWDRLTAVEASLREADDAKGLREVESLRDELSAVDEEVQLKRGAGDADDIGRLAQASRRIDVRLHRLEQHAAPPQGSSPDGRGGGGGGDEAVASATEAAVNELDATEDERREFALLTRDLERATAAGDERGVRRAVHGMDGLRWRLIARQDWFWARAFATLRQPGRRFLSPTQAREWIQRGEQALREEDAASVRTAVEHLWKLQRPEEAEAEKESTLPPGLKLM